MRFLRESAVEQVMHGHDHAARDQQGDVRRMSILDLAARKRRAGRRRRDRGRPRVGGQRSNGAAASRSSPRTRPSRCRRRARAVADRGQRRTIAPAVVAALDAACSSKVGRPRRIGLVLPDVGRARCRWCGSSRCRRKAQDLDQLVRWQVRKSAPFPIEDAQVSYVPGLQRRRRPRVRRLARPARRHRRSTRRCAPTPARTPASSIWRRSTSSTRCSPARGAPAGDWLLVNIAADYTSIALLRGPHLIFFRNRAADTDGTLADLVHQTAMYYEDRLKGAGFARVHPGRRRGGRRAAAERHRASCAAASRSGCSTPVETVDPRTAAALTDRIVAAPALLDALAPLVGLLLRDRARGAGVIRTNLSTRPFYNERVVHLWLLAAGASSSLAATAFNVSRVLRYSRSDTRLRDAGVARRGARRRSAAAGGAAARERRPEADRLRRPPTRGRPTI